MNELVEILRRGANDVWKLGLTEAQLGQFARYAELLVEWNENINLTRLTTPREIAVKHFLDSLAVLTVVDLTKNARIIDIGTGAGFPGLPLKIARPDLRVTLLDGTAKKLRFCRAVADALELKDVETRHGRAEDAARTPDSAKNFDFATARAVAPLARLLPWASPWVRGGGNVIALKGAAVAEEWADAQPVARRLHLTLEHPVAVFLPLSEESVTRQIVLSRRDSPS